MQTNTKARPMYFNPEKVGSLMQEIGVDYLKVESNDIETRWFREPQTETDIFVWSNKNKKIIKQQVSIMGLLTEWNAVQGVKTGMVLESEILPENVKELQTASEVVHFDKNIQAKSVEMSVQVIRGMTCIDEELKLKLIQNYERTHSSIIGRFDFPNIDRFSVYAWLTLRFMGLVKRISSCFNK